GPSFSVGDNAQVLDLEVMPGQSQTVAVSVAIPGQAEPNAAIYDGGVPREGTAGMPFLEFSADGTELYGRKINQFGNELYRYGVVSTGLTYLADLTLP